MSLLAQKVSSPQHMHSHRSRQWRCYMDLCQEISKKERLGFEAKFTGHASLLSLTYLNIWVPEDVPLDLRPSLEMVP